MTDPIKFELIEAPEGALPEGTLLFLPGPRRVTEIRFAGGRVGEIGETLEEYARRCVALRNVTG
jgi:hypothetical protein